jgi:hypothetical protein
LQAVKFFPPIAALSGGRPVGGHPDFVQLGIPGMSPAPYPSASGKQPLAHSRKTPVFLSKIKILKKSL